MPNAEYNPRRLHAIVARRRTPKASALIFATGKLVIMGATSEADARLAALKSARLIQKQGYRVRFREFRIQNIVGSAATGTEREGINLRNLARDYRECVNYEPEQFTGLQYQMSNPRATLMIFHNGKITIASVRTQQDLNTAFEKILPIVRRYPLRMVATSETVNSKEAQKLISGEDTKTFFFNRRYRNLPPIYGYPRRHLNSLIGDWGSASGYSATIYGVILGRAEEDHVVNFNISLTGH